MHVTCRPLGPVSGVSGWHVKNKKVQSQREAGRAVAERERGRAVAEREWAVAERGWQGSRRRGYTLTRPHARTPARGALPVWQLPVEQLPLGNCFFVGQAIQSKIRVGVCKYTHRIMRQMESKVVRSPMTIINTTTLPMPNQLLRRRMGTASAFKLHALL